MTEQEWNAERKRVGAIRRQVWNKRDADTTFDCRYRIEEEMFRDRLNRKYDHATRWLYILWHDALGSTTSFSGSPFVDFPGEYSMEQFYLRMLADQFDPDLDWLVQRAIKQG